MLRSLKSRAAQRGIAAALALIAGCLIPSAPAWASEPHERVVQEYLDGKWEALEADLKPAPGAPRPAASPAEPPAERADLDYIRKSLDECRPAWWNPIKQGKAIPFRTLVWGDRLVATFDPKGTPGTHMSYANGIPRVSVSWAADDMDSTAPEEHGFTKGDLTDLTIWLSLGTAKSWLDIPIGAQVNLTPGEQMLLTRYLEFRADVTGAYYGTPRARRWGLWLDLAAFSPKYEKMNSVNSRKAIGAFFLADVIAHPDRYPSLPAPKGKDEAEMADRLKGQIEHRSLTLPEDRALRDALKRFAETNAGGVRHSGKVKLPNGTFVALDPAADKTDAAAREAWLRSGGRK